MAFTGDPVTICSEILRGLDTDVVEYLTGGLVEDGVLMAREDAIEFAAPMLEEHCDGDEAAAEILVGKLWEALKVGSGDSLAVATGEDLTAPRQLQNAVRMGESLEEEKRPEPKRGDVKLTLYDDLDDAKSAKLKSQKLKDAQKEAEKKAAGVAAMTQEVAALNLELERAREVAARRRLEGGCSSFATIEVKSFQLPNPGGGADLLEEAACVLVPGHRYGLIGRNGKGKSTLLRHLAARRVSGFRTDTSVYYVHQEVTLSAEQEELTPVALVLQADVERRLLLEEAAQLAGGEAVEQLERLAWVEQRLEGIGAARAQDRVVTLLKNLGFSQEFRERPMKELSGGWRVRTALAAALFAKPDVLLLDEPTNHLSIDAVMWLTREIATSATWDERVVVVVSHDRFFLDETCTDTLHISGAARRLTQSRGPYSVWAARRAEMQKARERATELREQKADKLRAYTQHGFKYGGSQGQISMQQKKLKELNKLENAGEEEEAELADLNEDEELPLRLSAGGMLDKAAIQLHNVGFSYHQHTPPLFTGAEFSIDSKSRVCLLGENGAGKTTLVKLMQGELEPTSGRVARAAGCRIETVTQHHAAQLNLDMSPLQFLSSKFPGNGSLAHEGVLRGHLAGCGVGAELQGTLIRGLSGGQRSRVAMAAVSFASPHVLILDEPTNNLDLEAVAALADCVDAFEGGVILVSHDHYFVSRVAREVWVVGDGQVKKVDSFQAYKKKVLASMNKNAA